MKSSMKKLLIWLASITVVSLGIAAIILVITGNFVVATEKINESKTFKPEEISEIEVNLVSTDLNIIPTTKGEIEVHSEVGKGTDFIFTLPINMQEKKSSSKRP